ncbi:peptide/nickel transport system ATP-binding protein [Clostridium acetobutylicum]|uniref:Oligopeptide transport ATP-binding protein n=1 Tax=Clostridium acetobutylicum (strain ATCC 824 / DSM 792 / JCM 1419 / IAM 19013 / LMG 5710 / NBRC 13948 / NRRL B-527 / VKM B-1787 / 2291 / W) TaxID=272562 RepID=Q97ML7_CLOAB|nr:MULTISPECIES: ABC transporter ATP-binding protein [Clostridium]AAK78161.1 Oligopeptide transport ATP-binding protein [Clostridium acetobutylicum ATCC 824]ADZ19224.1 Oligopeptide transport ATP-binding protein [Clostridium acetobutylicum EA 2018]AEI34446.1 oligopeptide transport ATP-binding protein [Clostridium acetobutylicum DSM 1731]AWV81968.1 ABC transporter ATP-binding protein [Clostridium acetobutylicum]MBC2395964.1 ABC transporter ATP-binding protein [Clostridium acetobutylicum]
MSETLLQVKNLKTYFHTEEGTVKAVDDVSFEIKEKETLAIVGESGCGKSITAMSIMRLIPNPPGKIEGGEILFDGKDLIKMRQSDIREIRGNKISLIFQEPMTSLNPVFTVGEQIEEALILHKKMDKKQAKREAIKMLTMVRIPRAEEIYKAYPHELSGGMRQRVVIAMAISCSPRLLIADEPTTALDVTIQAQILDIMRELKEKVNTSIILITHDLGIVAEMADYVVVMYAGKIVEKAPVIELYKNPKHPYTVGLLKSKPVINRLQDKLYSIEGQVPNPLDMPEGCYFNPRCSKAKDICRKKQPNLKKVSEGHSVSCWLCEEVK